MGAYSSKKRRSSNTITIGWALAELLEQTAQRVADGTRSAATLRMQQQHVRWLSERFAPDTPLADVDEAAIDGWVQVERGGRRGRRLAVTSLAKRLSTLRAALKLAKRRRALERMPEVPVIAMPRFRPRGRILKTYAELRRLMAELPVHRAEWVAVAVFTWQHASDIERMTWGHVHVDGRRPTIEIRNTKNGKVAGWRVRCPAPLVEVLRARRERLTAAGVAPSPTDRLVQPWPNRGYQLPLACVRAGLRPMNAVDLRHTGASWGSRRGVTPAVVFWGGWASAETPSKYYAHPLPPDINRVARDLERMVVATPPPANDASGKGGRRRKPKR